MIRDNQAFITESFNIKCGIGYEKKEGVMNVKRAVGEDYHKVMLIKKKLIFCEIGSPLFQ